MGGESHDNGACHLILDYEQVVQFAVVPLGPAVGAGHGIDELRRDADAVVPPPYATLQHIACTQLPPDLPDIDRLVFVLEA